MASARTDKEQLNPENFASNPDKQTMPQPFNMAGEELASEDSQLEHQQDQEESDAEQNIDKNVATAQ